MLKKIVGAANARLIREFFSPNEKPEISNSRKDFYLQFLQKGDTYFDVGANFGNRIAPILNAGIKIVAIEPQKECVKYLDRKYGSKISIVNKGLGSKIGQQTFYISNASTLSSFSKDWIDSTKKSGRFNKYNWNKEVIMEITTLDQLIEEFGLPTFLKIDVEGYELEVLKGLNHKIPFISFEYTVPERNDSVIDCIKRLDDIYQHSIVYNYSIAESMEWALEHWKSKDEILTIIRSDDFISTSFGDIYIKMVGK